MNEPADPDHVNLQAWYRRVEKEIRAVDPDHILYLDGNTYAMDFSAFKEVLPNCVYAIHDYATMGFPAGEPYLGTPEQDETLRKSYERKVEFMKAHNVPVCLVPLYTHYSKYSHPPLRSGTANSAPSTPTPPTTRTTTSSTPGATPSSASN